MKIDYKNNLIELIGKSFNEKEIADCFAADKVIMSINNKLFGCTFDYKNNRKILIRYIAKMLEKQLYIVYKKEDKEKCQVICSIQTKNDIITDIVFKK